MWSVFLDVTSSASFFPTELETNTEFQAVPFLKAQKAQVA